MELRAVHRPVVVVGLDSLQGIQTVRIFRRHGVDVIAVASDRRHPHCRTNCVDHIEYVDTGSPALVERLVALASSDGPRPVLVPCQDKSVRVVSSHREALDPLYEIALPEQQTIDTLMDKASFLKHAVSIGLAVPPFVLIETSDDVCRAVGQLSFPCILKPSIRSAAWDRNTKLKVFVASSAEELVELYERCRHWADVLIAQEWIPGGDSTLYSFNGYFGADGRPLATFIARKLRQWPPGAGSSCLGEECRDESVLQAALELFGTVPYRGFGYLEMKLDTNTGTQYAIEANVGRPTGRSAIAEAGGVELLYTMYCDMTGLPLPTDRTQNFTGTKWIDLRHDMQSAFTLWRRRELTASEWVQSYRGPKAFAVASFRDPLPFVADLYTAVRRTVGSLRLRREADR